MEVLKIIAALLIGTSVGMLFVNIFLSKPKIVIINGVDVSKKITDYKNQIRKLESKQQEAMLKGDQCKVGQLSNEINLAKMAINELKLLL